MSYPMADQEMRLWCWAAVSLSVEKYFNSLTESTQCTIASAVKNKTCCADKESCNRADDLRYALSSVRRFRQMFEGQLSFESVRDSIREGFPVCARIGWYEGGGHYVVITGYRTTTSGERYVAVADPAFPSLTWLYDEFRDAYCGHGTWTHTYLVQQ